LGTKACNKGCCEELGLGLGWSLSIQMQVEKGSPPPQISKIPYG